MRPYTHHVKYYETDQMSIAHHSNYIRWMEEAKMDFLDQIGLNYNAMEEKGIISPVVSVECHYKLSTFFDDVVTIHVTLGEFKGVRLKLHYEIFRPDGEVAAIGESENCFTDRKGRPVPVKRFDPELNAKLTEMAAKE
ncbi:MAG: acyl-CoA thioesterase [Oscillospiraceae bacterium]|nr:acyl-CoA thioesterase [Oscillospiraceae bacterium]